MEAAMSPRGSDAEAAGQELEARTGFAPNAEQMIADNQERFTQELRAASNRPLNQQATDEMDEDEAQSYLDDAEATVLDYAVRGPFVVVVSEDEDGEIHKTAHVVKGKEKSAERLTRTAGRGQDETDEEAEKATTSRSSSRRTTAAASSSE
jgi:hypothetical protein